MKNDEIMQIINELKTFKMRIFDVPEEIQYDKMVIAAERQFGLRKELRRGYDVIHNFFFIEEHLFYLNSKDELNYREQRLTFETFNDFFEYLDGAIYENACYKYLDMEKYEDIFSKKNIDINKLLIKDSFQTETIDDVDLKIPQEKLQEYGEVEEYKNVIKEWIDKFEKCTSRFELEKVIKTYNRSWIKEKVDISFFLYCYINHDDTSKYRFYALMEYLSTGNYINEELLYGLCSEYPPSDIMQCYQYYGTGERKQYRYRKKLSDYVRGLDSGKIKIFTKCFYDKKTHYFCEQKIGVEDEKLLLLPSYSTYKSLYRRYFESFDNFVEYRNGDIRHSDFSDWLITDVDFSRYMIDESTKLPTIESSNLICKINKEYKNDKFYVQKQWNTKEGSVVKKSEFTTQYFFDFVYYLKGNLANSNLLNCKGLNNLLDYKGINFGGCVLPSKLADKFGVVYEKYQINSDLIESFDSIKKNEKEKPLVNCKIDKFGDYMNPKLIHNYSQVKDFNKNCRRIYYVSDIHLMHKIMENRCKSWNDIECLIQETVENIIDETGEFLLIGGDVSSEFSVFKCFVEKLFKKIQEDLYGEINVIFVLGNHELWAFPKKKVDEIVDIYRNVIESHGMYLLQNELIYIDHSELQVIKNDQLERITTEQLRKKLQNANIIIFGGIGFSGYNEFFNANKGIYRNTLNRNEEIEETKKFEKLYNDILPSIRDKNTIIFTHMPKKDWCIDEKPCKSLIYVNGHTHRNQFYDDGDYRIYEDNQIGYSYKKTHLKCFLIDERYDIFSDYCDGIYEITSKQYIDFYRGYNIYMEFTRESRILYMLKKNGYYCFIHKSKSGRLCILNGGALKKLNKSNIEYYYDHMGDVIDYIKTPLDKYAHIQQKISDAIIRLGGSGNIHGCIVDVDFNNHIYVNPIDLSVTGYWASDMVNKIVYQNVPSLLKAQCPAIYENYLQLEKEDGQSITIFEQEKFDISVLPQEYKSTDIYAMSREIKKMQKLSSNILSIWYDNACQERDNLLE